MDRVKGLFSLNLQIRRVLETKGNPSEALIKQELETVLSERFKLLFAKVQKHEADILDVGSHFRTKLSRNELKRWRTAYYPQLEMSVQVETDIQNEGFIKIRSK